MVTGSTCWRRTSLKVVVPANPWSSSWRSWCGRPGDRQLPQKHPTFGRGFVGGPDQRSTAFKQQGMTQPFSHHMNERLRRGEASRVCTGSNMKKPTLGTQFATDTEFTGPRSSVKIPFYSPSTLPGPTFETSKEHKSSVHEGDFHQSTGPKDKHNTDETHGPLCHPPRDFGLERPQRVYGLPFGAVEKPSRIALVFCVQHSHLGMASLSRSCSTARPLLFQLLFELDGKQGVYTPWVSSTVQTNINLSISEKFGLLRSNDWIASRHYDAPRTS